MPCHATLSHVKTSRDPAVDAHGDDEITVEEAGMFLLADNLSLIGATWFPSNFKYPLPAADDPFAEQINTFGNMMLDAATQSDGLAALEDALHNRHNASDAQSSLNCFEAPSTPFQATHQGTVADTSALYRHRGVPTRAFHNSR